MAANDKTAPFYIPGEFGFLGQTGTWALDNASHVWTLKHTDGDDTSVCNIVIPKYNGGAFWQNALKSIRVHYTVVTADLDAAPTAALYTQSVNETTGVVTPAAVTQAITFGGVDTVGIAAGAAAAGTHIAIITPTNTAASSTIPVLTNLQSAMVELTINAAGTSVLRITGVQVTYA